MMIVLEPRRAAAWCFLIEALDYRLSGQVPLEPMPGAKGWWMYDREAQTTVLPRFMEGSYSNRNQDVLGNIVGIKSAAPIWERDAPDLEGVTDPAQRIGLVKAELFGELVNGRLAARGRRLLAVPAGFKIDNLTYDLTLASVRASPDYEAIPKKFWSLEGTYWAHCIAAGRPEPAAAWTWYLHVQVNCEELLTRFPLKRGRPFDGASIMNGQLVLSDVNEIKCSEPKHSQRGRRLAYNWGALRIEAERRFNAGETYHSQEPFYEDMREFCVKHLGCEKGPSNTALRQHLLDLYRRYCDNS